MFSAISRSTSYPKELEKKFSESYLTLLSIAKKRVPLETQLDKQTERQLEKVETLRPGSKSLKYNLKIFTRTCPPV